MTASAGLLSDMGWGDSETDEHGTGWSPTSSAALLVAAGLYWGSVWLVRGFPPLVQLALCRRRPGLDDAAD